MHHRWTAVWFIALHALACGSRADQPSSQPSTVSPDRAPLARLIESSCLNCHDSSDHAANLDLQKLVAAEIGPNTETWEKVVRKLASRQMPPPEAPRPSEKDFQSALAALTSALDAVAAAAPNPGRTETFRRLNRTEYRNTIRDLLDLDVDVATLLPPDESSHGFDNVTVADLSPALLGRYLAAAETISRLAVGSASREPDAHTVRLRPDVTQDSHVEGLPFGTRGGLLIHYHFPQDGEYEVQVRLMRDRNDEIESLREPHDLVILLDRARIDRFQVKPPTGTESHQTVDANLKSRVSVTAGSHQVGVTFVKKGSSLLESTRQPLNVHFNFYRHPRLGPAVYEVTILGPIQASGPEARRSGRRTFATPPANPSDEPEAARQILTTLARRAYRRPVSEADLKTPLKFFQEGRAEGSFETGIERGLSAILVNPQFLFRIERDPAQVSGGTPYRISEVELASRLSYFLWSSMPDDELLELATRGELRRPEVLEPQVRRMLKDPRSRSLVENFAGQWLYLRNLDAVTPDMRLFPDFDDNLRQAMRRETELVFEKVLRDDWSVLDLVRSDATYLNERLARHYDVPHVYGSRFRRVTLDTGSHRGGLLRQASILTVTSYANRTSPVIRGQWVLKNLVGTPLPPPPPDVPALADNTVSSLLPIRERLQQHRADANCAVCHNQMDPVGFSLENFDAVGRWRETEGEMLVDDSGSLPDGSEFYGVAGLEEALLRRPELFVQTLTEKLLTFALGRGVEHFDAPAVRRIVREAGQDNNRFSALILGIVRSTPFQMRRSP
ncbi:DUF1592 domain-containing protein [Planctomyces sp. SH-PL14]|uniref:DUF1592 domain-containing protein n=1 Tax=Planctomyces sp. SH-PL14 TaxID=1632864 RepID=UPI00078C2635|nr:DUF1592 domain-containing protein [Planctomyces sp. SH-PL14]AMV19137.1 hypothetical protein VT03_14705 [Planctomyces sp. SH-PL14]